MGANITVFNRRRIGGEPAGDLDVRSAELVATTIDAAEVPLLVDELPLFALLAVHAHGDSVLRGAAELRAKETDRIEAVVDGLRSLGAHIRATPDGFTVRGVPSRIRAAARSTPAAITGSRCSAPSPASSRARASRSRARRRRR